MNERVALRWLAQPDEARDAVRSAQRAGETVGLVPTMGNLHDGHLSLIHRARNEADFVVVTVFVNPIQFSPGEDFERYPRTGERDRLLCDEAEVDLVFAPTKETMYPADHCTRVTVSGLESPLCGRSRPGHFAGVATVVAKLFNIIPADVAYFGMKDYQQAKVIERLVRDLDFPIETRLCPIVREQDGLALSSRNAYLSPEERSQAASLHRSLDNAVQLVRGGETDVQQIARHMREIIQSAPLARIEYIELVDADSLEPVERIDRRVLAAVAVHFGSTRLIDNTILYR